MKWRDSVSRLTVIRRALGWATGMIVVLAALSGIVDVMAVAVLSLAAGLVGLTVCLTGRRIDRLEARLTRCQPATLRGYLAAVAPGEVAIAAPWTNGSAAVVDEQLASVSAIWTGQLSPTWQASQFLTWVSGCVPVFVRKTSPHRRFDRGRSADGSRLET